MKRSMKVLSGLAAALALSTAQAAPINVGGVVWNPDSTFDFTAGDAMVETIVGNVGDVLTGYAQITKINGSINFCPGCELTYVFGGFTLAAIDPVTGEYTFTGGTINIYVDNTPDFDQELRSTAADGVLFLSLAAPTVIDITTGSIGTLFSDPTPVSITAVAGDGRGFLDVTGGLAAGNFDTNTRNILLPNGSPGKSDFQFTSSFQLLPNGSFVSDDGKTYGLFGTNDLQGNSIPEPGTLILAGLGLLGAGVFRRRAA